MLGSVELHRDTSGPRSYGMIHLVVRSEYASPSPEDARSAVHAAKATVRSAIDADQRLSDLIEKHGCRWELVDDYGMGTILLAIIDPDGNLDWQPGFAPK